MEALSRIKELELDGGSLHTLIQSMQDMSVTMVRINTDIACYKLLIHSKLINNVIVYRNSKYGLLCF